MKGSAARLHGGAQSGRGGRSGEVPGFIGRKLLKRGFRCVFKNEHDLFRAGIDGVRGKAEFPARHDWRGLSRICWISRDCKRSTIRFPIARANQARLKSRFIDIRSQSEGGAKIAI